ncbi:MAG: hypothetical protein K8823_376 [Cenarchaeum symbiont of Oopsacas minuta]|nr:hypothetical protein [Cenarchaeum symbiont of Oopsacas minuta]
MDEKKPKITQIPNSGSHNISIKPPTNNVIMIFVIQGKKNEVKVNLKDEIKKAVFEVFQRNKIERRLDNWMLKTCDGIQLFFNKSYKVQNIVKAETLFLTKGPGRGGQ